MTRSRGDSGLPNRKNFNRQFRVEIMPFFLEHSKTMNCLKCCKYINKKRNFVLLKHLLTFLKFHSKTLNCSQFRKINYFERTTLSTNVINESIISDDIPYFGINLNVLFFNFFYITFKMVR